MYILFHQHVFSINIAKNDLKCIVSLNLKGGGGTGDLVYMSVCRSVSPTFLPAYFTFLLTVSM